jgi:hypothetical protein
MCLRGRCAMVGAMRGSEWRARTRTEAGPSASVVVVTSNPYEPGGSEFEVSHPSAKRLRMGGAPTFSL